MFNPDYTISPKLLDNIKRISTLVFGLNQKHFSKIVLLKLEKTAREISAHASTSIEGNPLPLTDVKKLIKTHPENMRNSEREVLNYNRALIWLKEMTKKPAPFNQNFILKIHKLVTAGLMNKNNCGRIRREPVFVNNPRTGQTIYWPPDHQDVTTLLDELLIYFKKNTSTLDPLITAGLFHKQFVIIHPFLDGNGRTVRLATKALLARLGLNTFNLFSFENYYNQNVSRYFEYVGVTGNYYELQKNLNFTPWLEYFTDGIIDELLRVSKVLQNSAITPQTILAPHHQLIMEYIKKHSYITDKIYSSLTTRAKPTRNQDFNKLITIGMIERLGKSKSTIYRLKET